MAAEVPSAPASPPAHFELTRSQLLVSALSLVIAAVLLAGLAIRLSLQLDLRHWWVPLCCAAGVVAADFGSGLVHWGADTWGRDSTPVIGPRLLVPFRVHHVNPDDLLRRRFVDTNGELGMIAIPVLLALLAVPMERTWGGPVAVFGLGFCSIGIMTNQIHQWAHMPNPPMPIRVLQDAGLILGRAEHAMHHARPYDVHYCITTGWCNRPLEAIGFFRALESAVTGLTGRPPRQDDRRYDEHFGAADHGRG